MSLVYAVFFAHVLLSIFSPAGRLVVAQQPYIPDRERFDGNSNSVRFERGGGLFNSNTGTGGSTTTANSNGNLALPGASFINSGTTQRGCPAELDFTLHGCDCRQITPRGGALAIECDGTDAEQVKILLDKARRLRRQIE